MEPSMALPRSKAELEGVRPLEKFREELKVAGILGVEERLQIVDEALELIEHYYVHLPLKRAMHAVDPVQRLRLLRFRLEALAPQTSRDEEAMTRRFHDEMISIFSRLRDLHTAYLLPEPYQSHTAFLPFLIEEYFDPADPGRPRYTVSKVLRLDDCKFTDDPKFDPGYNAKGRPGFEEGVDVTHWNGINLRRVVELNADREPGSNEAARLARGLQALTIRPLAWSSLPDEDWVELRYERGRPGIIKFYWHVFRPSASPAAAKTSLDYKQSDVSIDFQLRSAQLSKEELFGSTWSGGKVEIAVGEDEDRGAPRGNPPRASTLRGIDARGEVGRRTKKIMFAPEAMELERPPETPGEEPEARRWSDVFSFRTVKAWYDDGRWTIDPPEPAREADKTFGHVRIWTFDVEGANAFVNKFVREVTDEKYPDGLLLDVRGNGGGVISAGEYLLQVLSPHRIEPERFHFINTPKVIEFCEKLGEDVEFKGDIDRWQGSLRNSVATGEIFSQGFPINPDVRKYNNRGQTYHGPVALIVDALCYSTTDIFAAGFQDHRIGMLLATSAYTGAGGANVWIHRHIKQALAGTDAVPPLPGNASFQVALRRSTRVGNQAGNPLEDLGVGPEEGNIRLLTKCDVLGRGENKDLIAWAVGKLAKETVYALAVAVNRGRTLEVTAKTSHIDRIDVFVDERPWSTSDAQDGSTTIALPEGSPLSGQLEVRGYQGNRLVAMTRVDLDRVEAPPAR
jgi:hypothetical protein